MLKDHSLASNSAPRQVLLDTVLAQARLLSLEEQIHLRSELDTLLPIDLAALDLDAELALQFQQAKLLLHELQGDKSIPINQKAQLFNAVRAQLTDIVKQQESVWSMERLKKYEVAFLQALKTLPDEAKHAFFDLYGSHLKEPQSDPAA